MSKIRISKVLVTLILTITLALILLGFSSPQENKVVQTDTLKILEEENRIEMIKIREEYYRMYGEHLTDTIGQIKIKEE